MPKMKPSLLAVVLALAGLDPAHAQELDAAAKKQLAIAGAAVGRALRAHDIAALAKLWSPKLLVNSPDNRVLTRSEVFEAIERGQLDYEGEYRSRLERIEFYGDVAVTMADETVVPAFGPRRARRCTAAAPTSGNTPMARGG